MDSYADGAGGRVRFIRTRPDGRIDPAGEAGWFLQRERERRGASLEEAAAATGVHVSHLDAIEMGDLTRMPHRSDALAMLAAYAGYLGFDPQPLTLHYAQLLPSQAKPTPVATAGRRPLGSAKIIDFPLARRLKDFASGAGGIVATLFGAVILFGGASWLLLPGDRPGGAPDIVALDVDAAGTPGTIFTEGEVTEVPADIALIEEPMPLPDGLGALIEQAADESAAGLDGIADLIAQNIETATISPAPAPAATKLAVAKDGKGRIFGIKKGASRLTLKATGPVWLKLQDAAGNAIVTETLAAGDRVRVPQADGLMVMARDGGMVTLEVDGEERGTLGAPGELIVGEPLDLEALTRPGGEG